MSLKIQIELRGGLREGARANMSSIQRRLIVWLTVACVVLLVATGAVIYRFFPR